MGQQNGRATANLSTVGAVVTNVGEWAEGVYVCRFTRGTTVAAQALSAVNPGQWWVGSGVVTWMQGRTPTWFVDYGQVERITRARATVEALGHKPSTWTVGGCARQLLKERMTPQPYLRIAERLADQEDWSYRKVRPGSYGFAQAWDLDAAYYNLLKRLPSPHLTPRPHSIEWHRLPDGEIERWRELVDAIGTNKYLRNVLIGTMSGNKNGASRYIGGFELKWSGAYGPLRAAALLVVRTCYELTGLQAQNEECVYANTDSVILRNNEKPMLWTQYGLPYSLRAFGPTDVRALCVYKCGDHTTKPFNGPLNLGSDPFQTALPEVFRFGQWL